MLEEGNRSPLGLFLQSLTVKPAITSWRYDKNGTLIETNCPHHVLHTIFVHAGCMEKMLNYGEKNSAPLILCAQLGLVWCAVFDRADGALRALLQMVRDGDTNYRSAMERAAQLSGGVRVRSSDPVLPAIISSATFTGLCSRAAIDGGLTPDEAYTLGDSYVQNLLGCKTITEVRGVNHAMYEDFIQRVHRLRLNPALFGTIQSVIDYVETHLEDKLTLDGIAAL